MYQPDIWKNKDIHHSSQCVRSDWLGGARGLHYVMYRVDRLLPCTTTRTCNTMACLLPPLRAYLPLAHATHVFPHRTVPLETRISQPLFRFFTMTHDVPLANSPPVVIPEASRSSQTLPSPGPSSAPDVALPQAKPTPPQAARQRPRLRASKAAITLVRDYFGASPSSHSL